MAKCKRCDIKTALSAAEIDKMVEEITHMRGIRLVSGEKYLERLNICVSCEKFLSGSTCGACGCVMQVRARLADGRCPDKKWN